MIYKAEKLFQGRVSVRDYLVRDAIAKREDLKIYLGDEYMIVPWQDLHRGKEDQRIHLSRFENKRYQLIDYTWKPTIEDSKQEKLI